MAEFEKGDALLGGAARVFSRAGRRDGVGDRVVPGGLRYAEDVGRIRVYAFG